MTSAWWETRWLLSATAWTIAGVGALAFLWAMCRDRSRGRTRCPKCWYDLAGLAKPETPSPWPITCPECGKKIGHERQTRRTRRHWRLAALALAMMLAAYPIAQIADAREFGPQRLLPLWLQAVAWPVGEVGPYDDSPGFDLSSGLGSRSMSARFPWGNPLHDIVRRLDTESPDSWYQRLFSRRVSRAWHASRPDLQVRCFSFSHLWRHMRGSASWRSREQIMAEWETLKAASAPGNTAAPTAGPDFSTTKASWIMREIQAMEEVFAHAPSRLGEDAPFFSRTIGSCVVIASSEDRILRLDALYHAITNVIAEGPGAQRNVATIDGQALVLRNISDLREVIELGKSDVDELLAPTRIDLNGDVSRWATYVEGYVCCGGLVLLVTEPEVRQRIVDERLSQLRAKRAKMPERPR